MRGGGEITLPSEGEPATRVVALSRVREGKLHETGEGHTTALGAQRSRDAGRDAVPYAHDRSPSTPMRSRKDAYPAMRAITRTDRNGDGSTTVENGPPSPKTAR